MTPVRLIIIYAFAIAFMSTIGTVDTVLAENKVVAGTINNSRSIDSDEGIIFDGVVLGSNAKVNTLSTFDLHLKPGTRIAAGARLNVNMRDNDGLSNKCELYYFNHLNYKPGDDPDEDILTNLDECTLGTDPTYTDKDNDDDGMEDWWEIKYFGLGDLNQLTANGRDDDFDGDGISNYIEYRLKTDPSVANDTKSPGLHYEYDKLGRIKQIQRIPRR